MTDRIETLKKTLDSLPSLTDKLQAWKPLLVKLNDLENNNLAICLSLLGNNADLKVLQEVLEDCELTYNSYRDLFDTLLSRLKLPINAYKERILELTKGEFRKACYEFRIKSDNEAKDKIRLLVEQYYNDFTLKPEFRFKNKFAYIRDVESMITGFLFQPPLFSCKDKEERTIYNEIFQGWDPNSYCIMFYKDFKEKMKTIE